MFRDGPAHHVWQSDVQGHCAGLEFTCQRKRRCAAQGNYRLEVVAVRHVDEDTRKGHVVLNDQQHRITRLDIVAVVFHYQVLGEYFRHAEVRRREARNCALFNCRRGSQSVARRLQTRQLRNLRLQGADVHLWQVESKCAANPGSALQADFSAEQTRQFAADGKAQTSSAVLATGRSVRLLKRLKDDALLFLRDANAGVAYGESHHTLDAAEDRMSGAPSGGGAGDLQSDGAVFGKFQGVGQ